MMKQVKVCYSKIHNMGDLLNELVIEKVLGYKVVLAGKYNCQTTGIGSGLDAFFPKKSNLPKLTKRIFGKIYSQFQAPLQIWSTGFITYSNEEQICIRKQINVAAVRGELTRKRLEKILNVKLDVPTADGGLLASLLVKRPVEKKYSVGIIPHFKERDEFRFQELLDYYDKSILIDVTEDPLLVIKKISQCEIILSSSLHGLVVADSFGIPNKRLVLTDKLMGDGYKFDDYYSAFGVSSNYFDLNKSGYPQINQVIDDYKISFKEVERKQNELINSFSKFL